MRLVEIAWLAGLLDGEASFNLQKKATVSVVLCMTDLDIVERASRCFHSKVYGPLYYRSILGRKPLYRTSIGGSHAIAIIMTIYSFLGDRRKEKCRAMISAWRKCRISRLSRNIPKCHPDKKHYAFDLCEPCYRKKYFAEYMRNYNREFYHRKKANALWQV